MFRHNLNIALQCIFSTSIPHNDTQIKASEVSNFNKACKWLLIAFCFENSLSQIAMLEGMTSDFCQYLKVSWDVADWYTTRWCPYKIAMPHTMICFHIHASKFLQTQATRLYLHRIQPPSIQILIINLSNHCSNVVIWAPSSLG